MKKVPEVCLMEGSLSESREEATLSHLLLLKAGADLGIWNITAQVVLKLQLGQDLQSYTVVVR